MNNITFLQTFVPLKEVIQRIHDYKWEHMEITQMTVSAPFACFLNDSAAFTVADASCDKDTENTRCIGSLWANSDFQIDVFLPNNHPMEGFILYWKAETPNLVL